MARIAGVNLPVQKRVEIGLRSIYGIGPSRARDICRFLELDSSMRVSQLSETDLAKIREHIEKQFKVEGDLSREVRQNIKRKTDLGSYEGLRHRKKLPVRGQRTHTNARTRKGKAVPIAGKKG